MVKNTMKPVPVSLVWYVLLSNACANIIFPTTKAQRPAETSSSWDRCDTSSVHKKKLESSAKAFDALRKKHWSTIRQKKGVLLLDIMSYGAIGNATTGHDDGSALREAAEAATALAAEDSAAGRRVVVLVPGPTSRTYLIRPITLRAIKNVEIRVEGTLTFPSEPSSFDPPPPVLKKNESPELRRMQYACIELVDSANVTLTGSGTIDGRGQAWWMTRKSDPRVRAPVLLLVRSSQDVSVTHLKITRSPFYHVVVLFSERVRLVKLLILSPQLSVNTDGIDILESRFVEVEGCSISTGDDNVAIKEGSSFITVRGSIFFHGHGLSIGSLGENHTTSSPVEHVYLAQVTFVRTQHAARIKSWQGGRGKVNNVTFQDLTCAAVALPIVVDQFYCPGSQHRDRCQNSSDAVEIANVRIDNIKGYHTSGVAAMLHCSETMPCQVDLTNIKLEGVRSLCRNLVTFLARNTNSLSLSFRLPAATMLLAVSTSSLLRGYREMKNRQR